MTAIPSVHINGTSRAALLRGYLDGIEALRTALEVMQRNGPNGRDFYPQGPDAMKEAQMEHTDRCLRVKMVMDELEAIAEAVAGVGR
jgi:hypothetical protein